MPEWTGERLETFIFNDTTVEHLHRYALAKDFVRNKAVLDIACGEGYGAMLLAQTALSVTGVDIQQETILNAKEKYKADNLNFTQGSTENIPCKNQSFDVVVSFETLEHVESQDKMMQEIKRVLKSDGILIISTPNKLHYTDQRQYQNPFHVKELYKDEFRSLINRFFKHAIFLNQRFGSSIITQDEESKEVVVYKGNYKNIERAGFDPHYSLAISSDSELTKMETSIFDGIDIVNEIACQVESRVRNSITYRTGNFLLFPLKKIRSLFRK